jgi:hypothetical protein
MHCQLACLCCSQAVPGYVPTYIFHETARLKGLGMASSGAKREFLLTNTDMEDIPYVERRRCGCAFCEIWCIQGPAGLRAVPSATPGSERARNPPVSCFLHVQELLASAASLAHIGLAN